jgi:hypothetical protein
MGMASLLFQMLKVHLGEATNGLVGGLLLDLLHPLHQVSIYTLVVVTIMVMVMDENS